MAVKLSVSIMLMAALCCVQAEREEIRRHRYSGSMKAASDAEVNTQHGELVKPPKDEIEDDDDDVDDTGYTTQAGFTPTDDNEKAKPPNDEGEDDDDDDDDTGYTTQAGFTPTDDNEEAKPLNDEKVKDEEVEEEDDEEDDEEEVLDDSFFAHMKSTSPGSAIKDETGLEDVKKKLNDTSLNIKSLEVFTTDRSFFFAGTPVIRGNKSPFFSTKTAKSKSVRDNCIASMKNNSSVKCQKECLGPMYVGGVSKEFDAANKGFENYEGNMKGCECTKILEDILVDMKDAVLIDKFAKYRVQICAHTGSSVDISNLLDKRGEFLTDALIKCRTKIFDEPNTSQKAMALSFDPNIKIVIGKVHGWHGLSNFAAFELFTYPDDGAKLPECTRKTFNPCEAMNKSLPSFNEYCDETGVFDKDKYDEKI